MIIADSTGHACLWSLPSYAPGPTPQPSPFQLSLTLLNAAP
jgi:hypothetical protein